MRRAWPQGQDLIDLEIEILTAILATTVAGWNVLQNALPRRVYGWVNLIGSAAIIGYSEQVTGLTAPELGLGPGAVRRGVRGAAPLAATVLGGVAAVASVPAGRELFRDERVERHGRRQLAIETLFRIPVGTALFEELLFRGFLQGSLRRRVGENTATAVSSVAFGFWHVLPAIKAVTTYRAGRFSRSVGHAGLSIGATVVGTAVAGVGFTVLGRRSRSVFAPTVLHATINSAAYVAAWLAAGES